MTNGIPSGGPELQRGDRIANRYELIGPLGRGGQGEVWKAQELDGQRRPVALKLIRYEPLKAKGIELDEVLRRLRREYEATCAEGGAGAHDGIATAYDWGESVLAPGGGTLAYISRQYVHHADLLTAEWPESVRPYEREIRTQPPLFRLCDQRALSIHDRLAIMLRLARTVVYLHGRPRPLIHRDLKPANVLVDIRSEVFQPVIIDFGTVLDTLRPTRGREQHTVTGVVFGTPGYIAPELKEDAGGSRAATTLTDMYGLGVILFEMLCGIHPAEAPPKPRLAGDLEVHPSIADALRYSDQSVRTSIAARRSTTPDELIAQLDGRLEDIVLLAMHDSASVRYRTVQFAEEIEAFLDPARQRPVRWSTQEGTRQQRWLRTRAKGAWERYVALVRGACALLDHEDDPGARALCDLAAESWNEISPAAKDKRPWELRHLGAVLNQPIFTSASLGLETTECVAARSGAWVASARPDNSVAAVHTLTGTVTDLLPANDDEVVRLCVRGDRVLTLTASGAIHVHDTGTGCEVLRSRIEGHYPSERDRRELDCWLVAGGRAILLWPWNDALPMVRIDVDSSEHRILRRRSPFCKHYRFADGSMVRESARELCDQGRFAVVTRGSRSRVIDLHRLRSVRTLHRSPPKAWDPSSSRVAGYAEYAAADGERRIGCGIWSVDEPNRDPTITELSDKECAWSEDGTLLLGYLDPLNAREAALVSTAGGRASRRFQAREDFTRPVLSGDVSCVVAATNRGRALLWSVGEQGGSPVVLRGAPLGYGKAAVNRDGSRITVTTGRGFAVFQRDFHPCRRIAGKKKLSFHEFATRDVLVATAEGSPDLLLLSAASGQRLSTVPIPEEHFIDARRGQGSIITVRAGLASGDGTAVRAWDLADGKSICGVAFQGCKHCRLEAVSDSAHRAVLVHFDEERNRGRPPQEWDGVVHFHDLRADSRLSMQTRARPTAVAISTDGGRFAVALPGLVVLGECDEGSTHRLVRLGERKVLGVAIDPGGKLAATALDDGEVVLWDFDTGAEVRRMGGADMRTVAGRIWMGGELWFSPDGTVLVAQTGGMQLVAWSVATGARLFLIGGPDAGAFSPRFNPEGTRLLTHDLESLRLWDVHTGALVAHLHIPAQRLWGGSFSPDGTRIAATGTPEGEGRAGGGAIYAWDACTPAERLRDSLGSIEASRLDAEPADPRAAAQTAVHAARARLVTAGQPDPSADEIVRAVYQDHAAGTPEFAMEIRKYAEMISRPATIDP